MMRKLAAVTAVAGLACGEGVAPEGDRSVSLSVTTGGSPQFAVAANDTITLGANTLVLERVQIVLREIELERLNEDACDDLLGDDDRCEEFETGPLLLDLPLNGSVTTVLSVVVDTGTYGEIEFDVHTPGDDTPADLAFLSAHPEFEDVSIRVSGTFNGTPFVFTSDLSVEQELVLLPPMVVTAFDGPTNLTILVDVSRWFVVDGVLVNPALANTGAMHEGPVKDNIKDAFEAYENDDEEDD